MDWVIDYYSKKSEWFGPPGIFREFRERASAIERLCGTGPKRILELGAGGGGTAAAMADLGHSVVALELVPLRVAFARELATGHRNLEVLEADFYTVQLPGRFDVVCYWDSFGIGTDGDQRRLLRRVAREWLAQNGCVLLDVFSPWPWAAKAGRVDRLNRIRRLVRGKVRTVDLKPPLRQRYDFDPVGCRFSDELWPVRKRNEAVRQSIRCYTPSDFLLLLEGTGLKVDAFEFDGKRFDLGQERHAMNSPLADAERYLVRLIRD